MNKTLFIILSILFGTLSTFAQEIQTDTPLKKVKIALAWKFQSQFAGHIMAKEKGFFKDEGYDVKFISVDVMTDPTNELRSKNSDYSLMWLIKAVENNATTDTPFKLIDQSLLKNHYGIIFWKQDINDPSKSITTINDLSTKRISLFADKNCLPYYITFKKHGITPDIIHYSRIPSIFVLKGAQAISATNYNELNNCFLRGINPNDINFVLLKDLGLDFPEDGLFCRMNDYNPEEAKAISRAIHRGWIYAIDHQKETLEVVLDLSRKDRNLVNRELMRRMLVTIFDSVAPKSELYGKIEKKSYENCVNALDSTLNLKTKIPFESFVREEARR